MNLLFQRRHSINVTKAKSLILFMEITAVYFDSHTKHKTHWAGKHSAH